MPVWKMLVWSGHPCPLLLNLPLFLRLTLLSSTEGPKLPAPSSSTQLQTLQLIQQRLLHFFLVLGSQLFSPGRQIERIDRHLTFGIDQSDFDIALLMRQARTDPVQQPRPVLRNHLQQRTRRGALIVEINSRRNYNFDTGNFISALTIAQHLVEISRT